jgi:chromate transporter
MYLGPLHLQVPVWSTLDLAALVVAVGAFIAIFRYKTGMFWTLAGSAAVGLLYYYLFRS